VIAAHAQVSAVPDRVQWRCEPWATQVACARAVLETIRREAVDGFARLRHGGLEVGGILFGRRTEESIEVLGAVAVECEHKLGPSFVLSATDETLLRAALTSPKPGTLQPVGLYISHSRRGFSVADTDVRILDRYIPEPWQMVLIVMPAQLGPTRAGFFVRGSVEGTLVCDHEVLLSPEEHGVEPAATGAPIAPMAPASPIVPTAPIAPEAPIGPIGLIVRSPDPVSDQANTLQRLQSFVAQQQEHWRLSRDNRAAILALLLLCVSVGALWLRSRAGPSQTVPIHLSELGSKLRIEWDSAQKGVRTASAATLEIRDGGRAPIVIPITRSGLSNGNVLYVPQSGNIEVQMKLMHGSGPTSESVIYFINPSSPTAPPAAILPAETAPTVRPHASETIPRTLPAAPIRRVTEEQSPARQERLLPADNKKQLSALPAKTFRLPVGRAVNASDQRGLFSLPDLPDIHSNQAPAPTLPLPNGFSILARPVSPIRSLDPPQLRTGRLIWSGTLRKNAVLSFSPEGASSGVVNGRLPGVPVKISLEPAELVDVGIAVYTKDRKRLATGETPGAWNGWTVVFYDWDPKRISEVNVVEAPGPANDWKRLVLRNGNRNASVLVVDWQRSGDQ
jgi:hypothetical protein